MTMITSMFSGAPKMPVIPKPPQPPQINQAQVTADQQDLIRRRQGTAADILTNSRGNVGTPVTGTATLLGQ